MNVWNKQLDLLTSISYKGVTYSVNAEWRQDGTNYPTFRVTITQDKTVDLFWLTPQGNKEQIWRQRQTPKIKALTELAADAILQHVKANLQYVKIDH